MKVVIYEQGSELWHEWRKGGIGASEISILTGSNPYSTPLQLWEDKCGYSPPKPMSAAMQHGVDNEDVARQWLNARLKLRLRPICVEDHLYPFMLASLDGYDFDEQVLVEIKCPVSERILEAARLTQSVPAHWLDQIHWQLSLTDAKRAILAIWDYRAQGCIMVEVCGSPEIPKMRELAIEFWGKVKAGIRPETEASDYIEVDNEELLPHLEEYTDLSKKNKAVQARMKELRNLIAAYGDDGNFTAFGYKMTRVVPDGGYDMQQMRLDGVDVDKYKKPQGIGYYKITPPKL